MKAVNGGADHRFTVLLNEGNEFICQRCFAGGVDAIDGYAKWMRASDRHYVGCELREDLRACHDVVSFRASHSRFGGICQTLGVSSKKYNASVSLGRVTRLRCKASRRSSAWSQEAP